VKNAENWAIAVTMIDILKFCMVAAQRMPDPRLVLEALAKNSLSSCAPSESYSLKIPRLPQKYIDQEYLPIDVLFGSYNPRSRRISIYVNSIEGRRRIFDSSFEDCLYIVRLHEFAHALVHLGIRAEQRDEVLYDFDAKDGTEWGKFLQARRAAFASLDDGSHEFIAQALTYAGVLALPERDRNRVVDVFHLMELRQPDQYRLSSSVKAYIPTARWEILLDVARGDADAYREPGFDLRTGLEELVCVTGGKRPADDNPVREWTVADDGNLSRSLSLALQSSETSPSTGSTNIEIEFLVDRFAGLKIEIFAREHPPPHFRVICGDETANYRIDDCAQINGGLRRHHKAVREWHRENRARLIDAWNRHRPSDCPVGAFREA
jgi:hypothetical protein